MKGQKYIKIFLPKDSGERTLTLHDLETHVGKRVRFEDGCVILDPYNQTIKKARNTGMKLNKVRNK